MKKEAGKREEKKKEWNDSRRGRRERKEVKSERKG